MGMKRVVAIIEVTYPADDPRTLEELRAVTGPALTEAVADYDGVMRLAACSVFNAYVDPDAEPSLPETGFADMRKDPGQ